ncbi:hypothetical protein HK100_003601, partial [Physocladia obscura]
MTQANTSAYKQPSIDTRWLSEYKRAFHWVPPSVSTNAFKPQTPASKTNDQINKNNKNNNNNNFSHTNYRTDYNHLTRPFSPPSPSLSPSDSNSNSDGFTPNSFPSRDLNEDNPDSKEELLKRLENLVKQYSTHGRRSNAANSHHRESVNKFQSDRANYSDHPPSIQEEYINISKKYNATKTPPKTPPSSARSILKSSTSSYSAGEPHANKNQNRSPLKRPQYFPATATSASSYTSVNMQREMDKRYGYLDSNESNSNESENMAKSPNLTKQSGYSSSAAAQAAALAAREAAQKILLTRATVYQTEYQRQFQNWAISSSLKQNQQPITTPAVQNMTAQATKGSTHDDDHLSDLSRSSRKGAAAVKVDELDAKQQRQLQERKIPGPGSSGSRFSASVTKKVITAREDVEIT